MDRVLSAASLRGYLYLAVGRFEGAERGRKWILNFRITLLDRGIAGGFMVVRRYRSGASYGGAGRVVNDTAGGRWLWLGGCLGRD